MRPGAILAVSAFLVLLLGGLDPAVFGSPWASTRGLAVVAVDDKTGEKAEVELYRKAHAVIIGIDQYRNLPYDRQLSYAVRDAKGVEEVLRRNFKFDSVITLYNEEATKNNIMKVLTGDLGKLTGEDSVFIFWAGHGITEKTEHFGDLGYLVPFDGSLDPSEKYKNISMTLIKDDISKTIPAKHVFYVMDACYSGILTATRGGERKTNRNLDYLREITKENVRQVLTAGSKDQQVLDGGPRGHSVFTGRLIEALENADDFITATELSTLVKEKVYSDAKARNHTQTPQQGVLFGQGDFVFIPSIERKVEDTAAKVASLEEEMKRLEALEEAAKKAADESARRRVEIERRTVEARLKAEALRQQTLEEERERRMAEEAERLRREKELEERKKAEEMRLASLKQEVIEKRKEVESLKDKGLSTEAVVTEMQAIDARINEIRDAYRRELAQGIKTVIERNKPVFREIVDSNKNEFETEAEFRMRKASQKAGAVRTEKLEMYSIEERVSNEYKRQVAPFVESLRKFAEKDITFAADELDLDLHTYEAKTNTYPVTVRTKSPLGGIKVALTANIPIPRDEAREFKQHFENGILRPGLKGRFDTPGSFRVTAAFVTDDSTGKDYDLFYSKFLDLGNGMVYDRMTRVLWTKDGMIFNGPKRHDEAKFSCESLEVDGLKGWRLPHVSELKRMAPVFHNEVPHPFINVADLYWSVDSPPGGGSNSVMYVNFQRRYDNSFVGSKEKNSHYTFHVWCVHGAEGIGTLSKYGGSASGGEEAWSKAARDARRGAPGVQFSK